MFITKTIIISTYFLHSDRKYRSSNCQSGIKNGKKKIYKNYKINGTIYFIGTLHWLLTQLLYPLTS